MIDRNRDQSLSIIARIPKAGLVNTAHSEERAGSRAQVSAA
jgi:hypothetical protein